MKSIISTKFLKTYQVLFDCIGLWWLLLSNHIMLNLSNSQDTTILKQPLGQAGAQLLITGFGMVLLCQSIIHAGIKEVIWEELQAANEHDTSIVSCLEGTDEEGALANCVWVLGDWAVGVVGVRVRWAGEDFD